MGRKRDERPINLAYESTRYIQGRIYVARHQEAFRFGKKR